MKGFDLCVRLISLLSHSNIYLLFANNSCVLLPNFIEIPLDEKFPYNSYLSNWKIHFVKNQRCWDEIKLIQEAPLCQAQGGFACCIILNCLKMVNVLVIDCESFADYATILDCVYVLNDLMSRFFVVTQMRNAICRVRTFVMFSCEPVEIHFLTS